MKKTYIRPEAEYIEFYSDKVMAVDEDRINSLGFKVGATEWSGATAPDGSDSWE